MRSNSHRLPRARGTPRGPGPRLRLALIVLIALVAMMALVAMGAAVAAAAVPVAGAGRAEPTPPAAARTAGAPLVDVNRASRAQLKTLKGVGDAEADRVIANRPYLSKAELVNKQALPEGVYVANKQRIIARQRPVPARKA